jgi:hypothetical protein
MKEIIDIGMKYGVTGFLAINLYWMNERLQTVENKLYNCYENNMIMNSKAADDFFIKKPAIVAVLPDRLRVKKQKRNG